MRPPASLCGLIISPCSPRRAASAAPCCGNEACRRHVAAVAHLVACHVTCFMTGTSYSCSKCHGSRTTVEGRSLYSFSTHGTSVSGWSRDLPFLSVHGGQSVVLTSLFRQALMALQLAANTISTSTGTKGDNPRVLCMMLASSRQNISL